MLHLKAVSRTQGNNRALKSGEVNPRTVALDWIEVDPLIAAFRRMVRQHEFDICELAITTYLCARAYGARFTALPIFLVRGLHHGAILRSTDSPVIRPENLNGTRVGVNRGYTVTTGVWARGILAREYGVDLSSITWVLSGDEHVADCVPPPNVVPVEAGGDIAELVRSGELAAAIGVPAGPGLVPLIEDPDQAAFAAMAGTGLYPINHLVVVRDELLAAHPDLGIDLFESFSASKQRYVADLLGGAIGSPDTTDRMYRRVHEVLGVDPLPYGIEPNRAMLQRLIDHAVEQGILPDRPRVEDLFHPSVRECVG